MKRLTVLALTAMLASACLFASNADQDIFEQVRTMTVSSPGSATYGTRIEYTGNRAVLWSQIPDSVAGAGMSCQLDSVYPFVSELADDIENNSDGTWNIDSIHTYWANWNGFSSWALVPNFRVMLYEDSGTLTMPKMNPSQTVIVEAANYTAYGSGPYQVTLDMTGLGFQVPAGRWWLVVQPSTSFAANGQTGWQCSVGIGNGQEWYQCFVLLGIAKWTSASAQGYAGSEAGFILYGEEAQTSYYWDFEDGWQGWTHTGAAYPLGWGIGAWNLNGATWIAPDHGDSSLWVDSDAAGSGGAIRDTAISPAFVSVPGGWLKWGIAFNFISANERLYLIMRGHNGTSWGVWDTLYYYPDGVDVPSRWDSVDVNSAGWVGYDSLQLGIYYSDSSSYAWYGVFDNIGPVSNSVMQTHDVSSVGFLSPEAIVAPSAQNIIGVVGNAGTYDETFDVHCVVTDLTDAVVLDTTVSATTLVGGRDTLDFGQVTMQDGQTYTYTMATLLAGDVNPANDTAVGTTVCTTVFWQILANLPVTNSLMSVGSDFDEMTGELKIYMFGGSPSDTMNMYEFDFTTNAWTGPVTMPFATSSAGCVSYQNKIYIFGGWSGRNLVWVYDCEGDSFYAGTPLPEGINDPQVVLDDVRGLVYIIGGGAGWTGTTSVQVYDIAANTWASGTAFPETRMAGTAAYLGNDTLVVAMGRVASGTYVNTVYLGIIDNVTPTTITWVALADTCPTARIYRPGYASYDHALYFFGGYSSSPTTYHTKCFRFTTADGWYQMPDMPLPGRMNVGGCAGEYGPADIAEGLIFAAGGYTPYSNGFACLHLNLFNYIEEVPGEISEVFTAKLVSSNIFRGELRVEFNLPMSSNVRFTVYDVTGRTVTSDNYSNVGAGAHNLVWQGRDTNGDEVSAGTYFFRLEASESVFSGKIIVAE